MKRGVSTWPLVETRADAAAVAKIRRQRNHINELEESEKRLLAIVKQHRDIIPFCTHCERPTEQEPLLCCVCNQQIPCWDWCLHDETPDRDIVCLVETHHSRAVPLMREICDNCAYTCSRCDIRMCVDCSVPCSGCVGEESRICDACVGEGAEHCRVCCCYRLRGTK